MAVRQHTKVKIYCSIAVAMTMLLSPNVRAQKTEELAAATRRSDRAQREFSSLIKKANTGNARAQYALGRLYEEGTGGVRKSLADAMSWYEESARNGFKSARERLQKLTSY